MKEENIKKMLIVMIVSSVTFLVLSQAMVPSEQSKYSNSHRVVLVIESEPYDHSIGPIQSLDKEQLLKLLSENISYVGAVEDLQAKIIECELALRGEIMKENASSERIIKLTNELSALNRKMDQKNNKHNQKVSEILQFGFKGFIGRGPVMAVNSKEHWLNFGSE